MGNVQGNDKNASEKQRKISTVRGRVFARLKSRNSFSTKDSIVDRTTDNEFTDIQSTSFNSNVNETADSHVFEKIAKRISQISQGADSAKDALDFANQNQFDNESSNVGFERIYDIVASSAVRVSSTIPITPPTLPVKSFHPIPNEQYVSLTSTTSENTKTVTSSPADIHTGLNQTTTTQTKATQRVIPEELWESTNVRTNNVFSNYMVLGDVVASNLTLIDDTQNKNDSWCGENSKINESECELQLNDCCKSERNIIFSTRSWDIAQKISHLFERRSSEIGYQYDTATQCYIGKVTIPLAKSSCEEATHALIFMIVGISSRYKQIIRYDLSGGSVNAQCFRDIVINIVKKCWDVGLKCNGLISDMGGSNTAVWKLFGIKEITNQLTPSTTDVIVLREQTSSSSDSIFTDPLTTPIGFATEINQCYYSEENICDASDVDKLAQLAREAITSRNYSRKTKLNSEILNKLSKLSVTNVDCYTTPYNDNSKSETTTASTSIIDLGIFHDFDNEPYTEGVSSNSVKNKVSPLLSSNIQNGSDVIIPEVSLHQLRSEMPLLTPLKVKKVELHELSQSTKIVTRDDATNEVQLMPTILQQQPKSTSGVQENPLSTVELIPVCSSTPQSDGNVLKKVASFTVERTNSDNTASKISRPSYVPEKLNFSAYEKFEGQMLLNWMSSSSQPSHSIADQDISQLIQRCCTNLLVAGVIKQISDKHAPIQETFRPNLMYEWTHSIKSSYPPTDDRVTFSTPCIERNCIDHLSKILQKITNTIDAVQMKIELNKIKLNECSPTETALNILSNTIGDLDMICSELITAKKNLLIGDILNMTDDELYVSCFNETYALTNDSIHGNKSLLNETLQSVREESMCDIIDNNTARGAHQNNCDINEVTECCETHIGQEIDERNRFEKWTQTDMNIGLHKDSGDIDAIESKAETIAAISTPSNHSLTNIQNGEKSIAMPPSSPHMLILEHCIATASSSMPPLLIPQTSAPMPPPPPMMPPAPPPMLLHAAMREVPSSTMPPPPPQMPPPPPQMPPPPPQMPPPPPLMPPPPPLMLPTPPLMPSIMPIAQMTPPPPPIPGNITKFPNSNGPPPPPMPTLIFHNSTTPSDPPPIPSLKSEIGDTVDSASLMSSNSLNALVGPSSSKPFSPTPLPMPTAGNVWFQANSLRKNAVKPPKPMKPLYWTRIVAPPVTTQENDSFAINKECELWQEIDETKLDNLDEFAELFSRPIIEPKKPKEEVQKPIKLKTIKVLDSKRSQSVGIFSRSLHVSFHEIEHAIYHCDTSIVSLESLQTLMAIKATPEELEMIHAVASQDAPLDPPEEFLLKLSNFSCSAERISCIVFQSDFEEGSLSVTKKVNTVTSLCETLLESEDLKTLFSIILTLGNFMNGGNRQRGQADGFGLEILGKLKDVKSKDSKITLLHFIVNTYISRCRRNTPLNDIAIPIPDPGDMAKAVVIDFKEIEDQVNGLEVKLNDCRSTTEIVISKSTEDTLQPFKDRMNEFMDTATKRIEKLRRKLQDTKEIFIKTLKFYKFIPKSGPLTDVGPGQFFDNWASFTNDFRDIWRKEMLILNHEITKKGRALYNRNATRLRERKVTPVKPGSLKDRILKLREKNNQKKS